MKLSDYVVRALERGTGARHAFLLSGGGMMHLLESVGRSEVIAPIPCHHEQAAAIAADAYGRVGGATGICMVTTGPGGTNAITGVAGAYTDSNPMVVVSGQVSRANSMHGTRLRQRGIQEVEFVPIVQSITKFSTVVRDPADIRYAVEKGLFLARAGRPGPVWIDVPLDVQAAQIDPAALRGFDPAELPEDPNPAPREDDLEATLSALRSARRPLVILGGGLVTSGARELVEPLVAALGVPVQTSWSGMDLVPEDHPDFVGRANTFGPRWANLVVQNADLLLVLGARLGMQHTGYNVGAFARGAYKIMVDLDPAEMEKPGLRIDRPIRADVRRFVLSLTERASADGLASSLRTVTQPWRAWCARVRARFPIAPALEATWDEPYVDPRSFAVELAAAAPVEAVLPIGSSGMGHTVVTGLYPTRRGQRIWTSKGLAAMGYGVPSAVGACFAAGRRTTITVVGEGGLQLNLQELQTIRHHRLPVKIFVWNNGGYHSIRMTQKGYFGGHFVGSTPESGVSFPATADLARTYGFRHEEIRSPRDLRRGLAATIDGADPVLCEVFIDPERPLEPKLASYQRADGTMASRPLEDMAPLLPREELASWMLVPLLAD